MAEGCALQGPKGPVRLKWHRVQRMASDAPFTLARLKQGLALGAVMEVDLRRTADGSFVCLHDAALDRETTGTGLVADASPEELRHLRMRGIDGAPGAEPLLRLRDLARHAAQGHARTQIQLDLKDRLPVIDSIAAQEFARETRSCADKFTLSGHDWNGVKLLGTAVPQIRLGFDPCDRPEAKHLSTAASFADFVDMACLAAPEAEIIYMHHRILLDGLDAGFNMIAAFQAHGREVDAWTLSINQPGLARDLQRLVEAGVDQITTGEPVAFETLWNSLPGSAA